MVENGIRGGVVMEDPTEDPALTLVVDGTPPPCVGDADGSGFVNKSDVANLVTLLVNNASAPLWKIPSTSPAYSLEADVDGSGFINKSDIAALVTYLVNNASAPLWKVPCP